MQPSQLEFEVDMLIPIFMFITTMLYLHIYHIKRKESLILIRSANLCILKHLFFMNLKLINDRDKLPWICLIRTILQCLFILKYQRWQRKSFYYHFVINTSLQGFGSDYIDNVKIWYSLMFAMYFDDLRKVAKTKDKMSLSFVYDCIKENK